MEDDDRRKDKYLLGPGPPEKRRQCGKNKKHQDYHEKNYSTTAADQMPSAYASMHSYKPHKHHPLTNTSSRPKCSEVLSNDALYRMIRSNSSKDSSQRAPVDNFRETSKTVEDGNRKYADDGLTLLPDDDDEEDTTDAEDEFGLREKDFEDPDTDEEVDDMDEESERPFLKLKHQMEPKGTCAKTNHPDFKTSYENYKKRPSTRFVRNDDEAGEEFFDEGPRVQVMQPKRSSWRQQAKYLDKQRSEDHPIGRKRITTTGFQKCPTCGHIVNSPLKPWEYKKSSQRFYGDSIDQDSPIDDYVYDIGDLTEATSKLQCSKNSTSKNRDMKSSLRSNNRQSSKIDTRHRR